MDIENEFKLLKREIVADKEISASHFKNITKRIKRLERYMFEIEQKCDWFESRMRRYNSMLDQAYKKKQDQEAIARKREAIGDVANYTLNNL